MEKILIVEDNSDISKQLKCGLGKLYEVHTALDGREAVSLLKKHRPKVVTLDLGLPPDPDGASEGLRCLGAILNEHPHAKVIVVSGNNERENCLKAVEEGAYDFYQKPINLDELKVIIARAFHIAQIEEENRRLHSALEKNAGGMGGLIGQCPEMLDIFSVIRKVASSDISVLVQGESGTGKELVARAIHDLSLRKDGPFVPINCGAIPETLIEGELFGHEKGSFTGAHAQQRGKLEYAHGGTLFLDEIGELPAPMQVKLLRFLQERIFQRVGGREDIAVDTRIISATNVDITRAIKENRFREDLYYRIGVITVDVPPLRERKGDVLLLSNLFLRRYSEELRKRVKGFSPAAISSIESYEWPGNVRELENKVKRAVIMSESVMVEPRDLGFEDGAELKTTIPPGESLTLKEARDMVEREMIIRFIDKHNCNVAKAAQELGISRPTLYDLMKKHNLSYVAPPKA